MRVFREDGWRRKEIHFLWRYTDHAERPTEVPKPYKSRSRHGLEADHPQG